MNKTTIYLAYAGFGANALLQNQMKRLRSRLTEIDTCIEVLPEPSQYGQSVSRANAFKSDRDFVIEADLMIAILEQSSNMLGMQLLNRCESGGDIILFRPKRAMLSVYMEDCCLHYLGKIPEVHGYTNDCIKVVVHHVHRWLTRQYIAIV